MLVAKLVRSAPIWRDTNPTVNGTARFAGTAVGRLKNRLLHPN
jgi:hypothetical protein